MCAMLCEKSLKKPPGKSWIIMRKEIHYFIAADKSHSLCHKISKTVDWLLALIGEMVYCSDLSCDLHDNKDEEKTERLSNWPLQFSFALISLSRDAPI